MYLYVVNVFIHKNINHIHNYVQKPLEKLFIPFRYKFCLGLGLAFP